MRYYRRREDDRPESAAMMMHRLFHHLCFGRDPDDGWEIVTTIKDGHLSIGPVWVIDGWDAMGIDGYRACNYLLVVSLVETRESGTAPIQRELVTAYGDMDDWGITDAEKLLMIELLKEE